MFLFFQFSVFPFCKVFMHRGTPLWKRGAGGELGLYYAEYVLLNLNRNTHHEY